MWVRSLGAFFRSPRMDGSGNWIWGMSSQVMGLPPFCRISPRVVWHVGGFANCNRFGRTRSVRPLGGDDMASDHETARNRALRDR